MIPGRIALQFLGIDGSVDLLEYVAVEQFNQLTYVKAIEDLLEVEMDEENREILMGQRNEALSYITILEQQLVVIKEYGEGKLTMDDLLGM